MDEKQIAIFDEIFNVVDEDGVDGIKAFATVLVLPDEQFEAVKPIFMSSIEQTFNNPNTVISLVQMMNQEGLKIEDFTDNIDNIVTAISEITVEDVELSESKKDLIKFLFTTFINAIEQTNAVAHRIINIPIELCRDGAKLPAYATNGSAAMDIYSPEEYTIGPGESIMIPTGLKVNIPIGYALLIQPRSGMSRKTKLRICNTPGLIDSDYHEEIGVLIENIDPPVRQCGIDMIDGVLMNGNLYGSSYTIGKGERFAQMRLVEVPMVNWLPVSSIGSFDDDHGAGFGRTGTK